MTPQQQPEEVNMWLIKGKLPTGDVIKMKSDAPDVYEAAKEFFNKLTGSAAKDAAKKMPSLSFKYKDASDESFVIAPAAKKSDKPAKKSGNK